MATKKKAVAAPKAPPAATLDEVNDAFNATLNKLLNERFVPHVLLLGVLRGMTLNLERDFHTAQIQRLQGGQ